MDFPLCKVAEEHHTGVYAIWFPGMDTVIDEDNPFILPVKAFKVEIPAGGVGNQVQGESGIGGANGLYMDLREAFGELFVKPDHFSVSGGFPAIGFFIPRGEILRRREQGKQGGQQQEYLFHRLDKWKNKKPFLFEEEL